MNILGISAYYHDSAACLLVNGKLVAAAEEERFSRRKHDASFPTRAIRYCLAQGGIDVSELHHVAFYDKPMVKFIRIVETMLATAPWGLRSFVGGLPSWLRTKLWIREQVRREIGYEGEVLFGRHHESHAASAFYPSPFREAAILTLDGVGEWATTGLFEGRDGAVKPLRELRFPHSLGLLYSAFTGYLGFRVNSGEYKVMGLAPYGRPVHAGLILSRLLDLRPDGSFWLNMDYFDFLTGQTMVNEAFCDLFGGPARVPESPLTQRHMDLAASIQQVTEEAVLGLARQAHRETALPNLCLAGGVALNCVANGRVMRETPFERLWIQPAAGDAGGALGVAYAVWHRYLGEPRSVPTDGRDSQHGSLLGPSFDDDAIAEQLGRYGARCHRLPPEEFDRRVASLLAEGQVGGWFQGRAEFGPRALGARSILADPRNPRMQSLLNLKIKFRESFRPFAPAVWRAHVLDAFDLDRDSPYMLLVAPVAASRRLPVPEASPAAAGLDLLRIARSDLPAVTHVDGSSRIQTVDADSHPRFHALLDEFHTQTGCPVLVNTSFNVRGEPIVGQPSEAYECFMKTEMDFLAVGSYFLDRREQPPLPRAPMPPLSSACTESSPPTIAATHAGWLTEDRRFGLLMVAACSVFGAAASRADHSATASGLAILAMLFGGSSLASARWLAPARRGWLKLGSACGWFNTRVLLSAIYVLVFVPGGMAMRIFGRDPLSRRKNAPDESYWHPVPDEEMDTSHFERPF